MSEAEYQEALKLGRKEYKNCLSKGRFPYLPVLDDILSTAQIQTEQPLGLVHVPLQFVVGTSTKGRTTSFAANFMPILDMGTEFSFKWANLADAQLEEGIRDPIIAYEYMNRYYVVEGNKRVSVLKYYNAVSIPAIVTRKIPKYSQDEDVRLYYEFMKFNEITGLYTMEFTKLGNAQKLLELMGHTEPWDEKVLEEFNRILFHFERAYKFRGGDKLPITEGDALVAFLNVYGYDTVLAMNPADYNIQILKAWNEIVMMTEKHRVGLVMDPSDTQEKKNILTYFLPSSNKKFTVAFLYPKSPEVSDWIYAHELGRNYLEETFHDRMETICVSDVNESNIDGVLNDVILHGADIIFGVAPQMMKPCLKVAVDHPEIKILNCSLNTPHKYIRTYYARMYEAKFLSGMIAGAMAENDKIAYIADYPIYGMIANINAFALGASCTNPRAKVYLEWSTRKGYDRDRFLQENDIHYVSDQDMITPNDESRRFGLYRYENGVSENLVMPLWNWGIFYEKMIQSILAGSYQSEGSANGQALNYWWGMSAGVIDLIYANNVPVGLRRMASHLRKDICKGDIVPFYGEIYAQDGTKKNEDHQKMAPTDIMTMDYLVENVVGFIPQQDELVDGAKAVVALKGVEENK
jgi:basic membrane lipoprotein Med (substrate-binding protein (PBP1-ABC) superfamily)